MKEVLTQEEIDLLLSALETGKLKTEDLKHPLEAKPYDFRRPNKFSKDQLRTLYMIHENYARVLSNFLSAYVRGSVQLRIATVDQVTYEDFLVALATPLLMVVFTPAPLKGNAVLTLDAGLIFPLFDLLFGGTGQAPLKVRGFTDIEIGVLRRVANKILEQLAFAWGDIFQFCPAVEALETNPQLSQVISPGEIVAVITFTAEVGKGKGLLSLCFPFLTLQEVLEKLTAHYWFSGQEEGVEEAARRLLVGNLNQVPVNLVAICGEATLTVRDFLALQPGDVVTLESRVGEDFVKLCVEDQPKFRAQPGLVGTRLALQITRRVEEGKR